MKWLTIFSVKIKKKRNTSITISPAEFAQRMLKISVYELTNQGKVPRQNNYMQQLLYLTSINREESIAADKRGYPHNIFLISP